MLDDGRVVELADPSLRTPHAGPCRTANPNSAYYGIAAATNGLVPATEAQLTAIATLSAALMRSHGWHQAIWTPQYTGRRALWGQLGRKVDPRGQRPDGRAIIDLADMRSRIQHQLTEL